MQTRSTTVRYRTLAWLTAAAGLAYLCRHAISVPESTIRHDLDLTISQSFFFQGAFFWTYAILQVPAGWFSERFGTRVSLTLFAVGSSIAILTVGLASAFWLLVVAQLVMGAAQAGIIPAAYNSIGHWMPISQRAFGCGVFAGGMQVGAIAATALAAKLISPLGWRWMFFVFAIPGFAWAIGFYWRFRDRPSQSSAVNSRELALILAGREQSEEMSAIRSRESTELLAILRCPAMWWLCGQQIFRSAGYMFFASSLPTFLQETRGLSVENSGYMQSGILVAMLPGTVLSGLVTDWIWRKTGNLRLSRTGVATASLATCALCILAAWFVTTPNVGVALLASAGFFAALGGPCAFAAAIDIAGPRVPQVAAIMNMSGNFAAAASPNVVSYLLRLDASWNQILLLFTAIYLASAACWIFVNPRQKLA